MTTYTVTAVTVTKATGIITSNNTNVSAADPVTIGTSVYTFRTSLTASTTAYEVLIGASADASLLNLIRAINGSGTPGTDYGSLTPQNTEVTAATSVTAHAFVVTAVSGLIIATSTTAATLSWASATLTGGSVAITATASDVAIAQPSQMVTIGDFPPANGAWQRQMRLTNAGLYCLKNFVSGIALVNLNLVAYSANQSLTWLTQPEADSVVFGAGRTATFTVGAGELTPSAYAWEYSANGKNGWASATGTVNGCPYTGTTTATLTCTPTTAGQDGTYVRCRVTTPAGVVTSSAALLTITAS